MNNNISIQHFNAYPPLSIILIQRSRCDGQAGEGELEGGVVAVNQLRGDVEEDAVVVPLQFTCHNTCIIREIRIDFLSRPIMCISILFPRQTLLPRLETMYIAQLDTKIVVPVGHGAIFAMMQPVFVISREFVLECQVGHHPEP